MKIIAALIALVFAQAAAGDYAHMTMKVEKLAPNFYTITGLNGAGRTGGAIGVLTGPDGNFMVDASFARLGDNVEGAIKTFPISPARFICNNRPQRDHTGAYDDILNTGTVLLSQNELRTGM